MATSEQQQQGGKATVH